MRKMLTFLALWCLLTDCSSAENEEQEYTQLNLELERSYPTDQDQHLSPQVLPNQKFNFQTIDPLPPVIPLLVPKGVLKWLQDISKELELNSHLTDMDKAEILKWVTVFLNKPEHRDDYGIFIKKTARIFTFPQFEMYVRGLNKKNEGFKAIAESSFTETTILDLALAHPTENVFQNILFKAIANKRIKEIAVYHAALNLRLDPTKNLQTEEARAEQANIAFQYLLNTLRSFPEKFYRKAAQIQKDGVFRGEVLAFCHGKPREDDCLQGAEHVDLADYVVFTKKFQVKAPLTCPVTPQTAPPSSCQGSAELFPLVKNIVRVEISGFGICSGSFISDRHLITAAHCFLKDANGGFVEDNLLTPNTIQANTIKINHTVKIHYAECDGTERRVQVLDAYLPAQILTLPQTEKETIDVAILRVAPLMEARPAKIYSDPFAVAGPIFPADKGVPLLIGGYPLKNDHRKTAIMTYLHSEDVTKNMTPLDQLAPGPLQGFHEDDPSDQQSFSGGPLYLQFETDSAHVCPMLVGTVQGSTSCLLQYKPESKRPSSDSNCMYGTHLGSLKLKDFMTQIVGLDGLGVYDLNEGIKPIGFEIY